MELWGFLLWVFSLFFPVLLSLFFLALALSPSGVIAWEMEEEEVEVFPCKEQMLEEPILVQLAASPVSQTHWRAGSKAWPLHSPARKDRDLEKIPWQHNLIDFPFKKKKKSGCVRILVVGWGWGFPKAANAWCRELWEPSKVINP